MAARDDMGMAAKFGLKWVNDRRKPGGRFEKPITGFGAIPAIGCPMTLWVPSDKVSEKRIFQNGVPVFEKGKGIEDLPELVELRNRVLATLSIEGPGVAELDVEFIRYVAALLLTNYTLNDDELSQLLTVGGAWEKEMASHLIGPATLKIASRITPELVTFVQAMTEAKSQAIPTDFPFEETPAIAPAPQRSWMRRTAQALFGRAKNRRSA